jgi:sec-independent protein translocase protein TatA
MLSGLENPLHILILCVVILLVFGAKRLPEMGQSLGTGMREFKAGITGQHGAATLPDTASPLVATPADAPQEVAQPPEVVPRA